MKKVYLVNIVILWKDAKGESYEKLITKAFDIKQKRKHFLKCFKKDFNTDNLKELLGKYYCKGDTFKKINNVFFEEYIIDEID